MWMFLKIRDESLYYWNFGLNLAMAPILMDPLPQFWRCHPMLHIDAYTRNSFKRTSPSWRQRSLYVAPWFPCIKSPFLDKAGSSLLGVWNLKWKGRQNHNSPKAMTVARAAKVSVLLGEAIICEATSDAMAFSSKQAAKDPRLISAVVKLVRIEKPTGATASVCIKFGCFLKHYPANSPITALLIAGCATSHLPKTAKTLAQDAYNGRNTKVSPCWDEFA